MQPYCDHRNNEMLRYIETENYLFMMNTSDDFNIFKLRNITFWLNEVAYYTVSVQRLLILKAEVHRGIF